jgi:hypothetical protein
MNNLPKNLLILVPSKTSAYLSAISSYVNVEATNSAFLEVIQGIATDAAGISEILAWETSIESLALAGETAGPSFLSGLPTQATSIVAVILSAEASFATEYGFSTRVTGLSTAESITQLVTAVPAATVTGSGSVSVATSNGKAAAATGNGIGTAAAGLIGLLGVVIAL